VTAKTPAASLSVQALEFGLAAIDDAVNAAETDFASARGLSARKENPVMSISTMRGDGGETSLGGRVAYPGVGARVDVRHHPTIELEHGLRALDLR